MVKIKLLFQLLQLNWKIFFLRREFVVPDRALVALRNALVSCERSPKQLLLEANQLSDILTQGG